MSAFWDELFDASAGAQRAAQVPLRVLFRHGQPFLLLPEDSGAAAQCLALYPAQSSRARAARMAMRWMLRAKAPIGLKRIACPVDPSGPFMKFLRPLAGTRHDTVPRFGILAGNSAHESRRFLILLFDERGQPAAVVKTGLSPSAKALVNHEGSFLSSLPSATRGLPKVIASFQSPRQEAFATAFIAGDSPGKGNEDEMAALLESWLDAKREILISESPSWTRLERAGAFRGSYAKLRDRLGKRKVVPALAHGDFTPWNVKVFGRGAWTVLDWERGELDGIPAWDWLHYIIQPGILVARQSSVASAASVEKLFSTDSFKSYAQRAGISGMERDLALGYLLHIIEVIKPAEGLSQNRELLELLTERWS